LLSSATTAEPSKNRPPMSDVYVDVDVDVDVYVPALPGVARKEASPPTSTSSRTSRLAIIASTFSRYAPPPPMASATGQPERVREVRAGQEARCCSSPGSATEFASRSSTDRDSCIARSSRCFTRLNGRYLKEGAWGKGEALSGWLKSTRASDSGVLTAPAAPAARTRPPGPPPRIWTATGW
jgi:hypothetical protein